MKIEQVNTKSTLYPALSSFIQKNGLLFNAPDWIRIYPEHQIHQCAILNNNNEVIGCFCYYSFKKAIYKLFITPPYAPDIELFYVNPSESVVGKNTFNKETSEAIAGYFDSQKHEYLNLNLPQDIIDTQPFTWRGYTSRTRYSYLIDLSPAPEVLKANLSSEKRKSLNKAEKDGVEVHETKDYELVYSLVAKSLERNEKLKNSAIIKNILFSFARNENSYAFVAKQNGRAIGATFCLINKRKSLYLFGGFDADHKHHGAGVACMWQSILKAKELGLGYFDFEGSMNASIERYFREFGGQLVPYFCVEKVKPTFKILMSLRGRRPV